MSYWIHMRRRLMAAALAETDVAALKIAYTGNMTDEIVTMATVQYRLLTLTSSGTLTIPREVSAEVWLCGGGANGEVVTATSKGPGAGGGGGYVASGSGKLYKKVDAQVGAPGQKSFISAAGLSVSANGATDKNGGSGGGGGYYVYGGTGAGVTTYPFGDTEYFAGKPHCAGGGGGGYCEYDSGRDNEGKSPYKRSSGMAGGSDGAGKDTEWNTSYSWSSSERYTGGAGGVYGGGSGGGSGGGGDATYYGGGGGGGNYSEADGEHSGTSLGGVGYQGVIYIRIPINQKEAA